MIDTSLITDMSHLFSGSGRMDFSGIEDWDVSNVTDMSFMFFDAKYFNQPLNSWNVSKVENMWGMFSGAKSFNQPLDSWNVSKVTDMECMFENAKYFNQPLDSWNVRKVKNMEHMFLNTKLKSIPKWYRFNIKIIFENIWEVIGKLLKVCFYVIGFGCLLYWIFIMAILFIS